MASTVKNFDKLLKEFNALDEAVKGKLGENAVLAGCLPIENRAKDLVRVKTGTAKRSIQSQIIESLQDKILASIGTPTMSSDGVSLSYTWFLELRYPFLRPAFDSEKQAAIKEIGLALQEQIRKVK